LSSSEVLAALFIEIGFSLLKRIDSPANIIINGQNVDQKLKESNLVDSSAIPSIVKIAPGVKFLSKSKVIPIPKKRIGQKKFQSVAKLI
jgi:hypothetical protein